MGTIFSTIIMALKAWPLIDKWLERFFVAYKTYQKEKLIKDNAEAIHDAIKNHDQRKLEEAIGHPHPGNPSGDAGSSTRPGMHN